MQGLREFYANGYSFFWLNVANRANAMFNNFQVAPPTTPLIHPLRVRGITHTPLRGMVDHPLPFNLITPLREIGRSHLSQSDHLLSQSMRVKYITHPFDT